MPQIIPIRDLKNTGAISDICHKSKEPVFVTKNGYGDMVIMSLETYEKTILMNDIYRKLDEAEHSIETNEISDGFKSLNKMRETYGL